LAGWQQALTVFLIVIPGFVYQGMRARFRGPTPEDQQEFSLRVLRALATSAVFALVYAMVLGFVLIWTGVPKKPERIEVTALEVLVTGFTVLAVVFLIPSAVALVLHIRTVRKLYPELSPKGWFRIYDPTPTAWDFAINRVGPAFVRVLLDDGRWVGGYAGPDSFYTGYPEAREIFVERGWQVNEQGEFAGEVENTAGRWIKCDDAVVVEFIKPAEPAAETKGSRATKLGWTLLVLGLVVVRWCRGEGSDGRG
jgi:heme/copper-type cytochrome/quinol oxidase subunit 2